MTTRYTRRGALGASAGIVAAGLAGCVGSTRNAASGSDSEKLNAQASFFVIGDFARQVAGDVASVNTVVPTGQHGHGWEPGPDVQRDVLTSDVFVSVMKGFQPWADDVITNIETDGADVRVIEAAQGISLIGAEGGEDEHSHDGERGHGTDHDGENGSEGHNETNASGDHAGHGTEPESDHGHERDHNESSSGENGTNESDGHGHEASGDQEEGTDPHFWLDPQRASQAVENVRIGLTLADPADNAAAYQKNVDAYAKRLADLDRRFAEVLEDAPKRHVLVAGHDAFGYLGARYDFRVHSLTGLAPDDQPTPRDVSEAQAIIDEHDIEYVLAPQLESKRAATQLVAETSAKGVLDVTPLPGTSGAWEENGWGYVEIMANVNLPSFGRALGVGSVP